MLFFKKKKINLRLTTGMRKASQVKPDHPPQPAVKASWISVLSHWPAKKKELQPARDQKSLPSNLFVPFTLCFGKNTGYVAATDTYTHMRAHARARRSHPEMWTRPGRHYLCSHSALWTNTLAVKKRSVRQHPQMRLSAPPALTSHRVCKQTHQMMQVGAGGGWCIWWLTSRKTQN